MNGYSNEQRTKNLTLRDIHVGDWVQVWRPLPKEYTPPMKVSSIHYDGTVYLVSDDEGHCNPYEANIKDIDALPITPDLLIGFGFDIEMYNDGDGKIRYNDNAIAFLRRQYVCARDCSNLLIQIPTDEYYIFKWNYMHKFIAHVEDLFDTKLEWKGIEK